MTSDYKNIRKILEILFKSIFKLLIHEKSEQEKIVLLQISDHTYKDNIKELDILCIKLNLIAPEDQLKEKNIHYVTSQKIYM